MCDKPLDGHRDPYQPSATDRAALMLTQQLVQSEGLQCGRTEAESGCLVFLASTEGCPQHQWHRVKVNPSFFQSLLRMKKLLIQLS